MYLKAVQAAYKELQSLKPNGRDMTLSAATEMSLLVSLK